MKIFRITIFSIVLTCGFSHAAEWQWSVEVKAEKPQNGPARAWLWIPPQTARTSVRVVVA